jgi:hypothetical protein
VDVVFWVVMPCNLVDDIPVVLQNVVSLPLTSQSLMKIAVYLVTFIIHDSRIILDRTATIRIV